MPDTPYQLAFIGAGNMAEAIARAAIDHLVFDPAQLVAADPSPQRRQVFLDLGVAVTDSNAEAIDQAASVLLAVKPQVMADAARDLAYHGRPDQVVITILAGITCAKLGGAIGRPARLVRVMPNTPMMIGRGMAGIALGPEARPGDDALALRLFSAGSSQAIRVEEDQLDAITAVSGSGPAYLFYLAEAMEQAAADLGLADHAQTLVTQTLLGATELLAQSRDPAATLRRKVMSPGGTTEAACQHLDGQQVKQAIIDALAAAERRSKALGA
ncbi:MAG: pyrroline-5-carboxylate reductase [Planctomycetes bacterium]|jgi:pyrroline-5-carboxylate reductase|nr:pyrroline-5-carboxylate reductase [Planctomycetota bacterium]